MLNLLDRASRNIPNPTSLVLWLQFYLVLLSMFSGNPAQVPLQAFQPLKKYQTKQSAPTDYGALCIRGGHQCLSIHLDYIHNLHWKVWETGCDMTLGFPSEHHQKNCYVIFSLSAFLSIDTWGKSIPRTSWTTLKKTQHTSTSVLCWLRERMK